MPFVLEDRDRAAIDKRMDRLLRDLGRVEPPLPLELVRDRLNLDLGYFSREDPGLLRKGLHHLKVGARQLRLRPQLALEVVQKLDLRAVLLPDAKRIIIDDTLPAKKQRWAEAHEIGHRVLPWHGGLAMGDRLATLSPACHHQTEGEANYAGGRLLFLGARFEEELPAVDDLDFRAIQKLHRRCKNSLTTTLWRTVEAMEVPAFGLLSLHPRDVVPVGTKQVRHFLCNGSFKRRFPGVRAAGLFTQLGRYCFRRKGPVGSLEISLFDTDGREHTFLFESFDNQYDILTLGTWRSERKALVAVA